MRKMLLSHKEIMDTVPAYDEHILFALERRYFDFLDLSRLEMTMNPAKSSFIYQKDLRMLRLTEVSHEGSADWGLHLMNFQNVLAAMKDDSHNVVAVVNGKGERVTLNYGLSKRMGYEGEVSTHNYAGMLRQAIAGNFLGAKSVPLSASETMEEIIEPILTNQEILAFPGIPSLRDSSGPYVQGLNRFIESMRGEQYCLVIIAEPIPVPDVDGMIRNLFNLSSAIHSNVKATFTKTTGASDTVNVGMFGMKGLTEGASTTLLGFSGALQGFPFIGGILGYAAQRIGSAVASTTETLANTLGGGAFGGYARGWNRSTAATQEVLNKSAEYCEQLCNTYIERLQRGKNLGFWNVGVYLLTQDKYTQLRGHGLLRACLAGDSTHWEPIRSVKLNGDVLGEYLVNFNNPKYNLLLYGEEKKQFGEAATGGAKLREYAASVGKKVSDLLSEWGGPDLNKLSTETLEQIRRFPGKVRKEDLAKAWTEIEQAHLGHPLGPALGGVSTPMNTEELSIVLNVPRQEVLGVSIREAAPFGVDYKVTAEADAVHLGHLVHKRTVNNNMPFALNRSTLQKHMFICGVTGSGKTNTCFTLLQNLELPFLVIEPAKSEYRQLLSAMPDLQVYTLGNEIIAPFRLNPFEFPQGGHLLGHIDNLKAVFNAAFPMYASMPYILEEAIIEVYTDKGWDLATSQNIYISSNADEQFHDYLPTLQELFDKIEKVVAQKQYAQEQTMNIGAALKARLSSLLTGSKGLMLNTKRSTPIKNLLEGKVLLELKHIGDDDEKCFLMGLILSQIYEYRDVEGAGGSPLRHVILIEEAHRLLKRVPEYVSSEVGNTRGKAVETFSNVISEIRDYGEGIIVVDQIPAKLTQDVIKNTNIKIVHRTLALDDRDMVGNTIGLTPAQSNELPLLSVGQAVIHSEGADKPFLVQMEQRKAQGEERVSDDVIRTAMGETLRSTPEVFRRYPGFEKKVGIAEIFRRMDFKPFDTMTYRFVLGGVIRMLAEDSQLSAFKLAAERSLQESYRPRDALETDCRIIWAANRFFERLGDAFPRTVDKQIRAHGLLIDAWFEDTQKDSRLSDFHAAMTAITFPESPLRYMMRAVVAQTPEQDTTIQEMASVERTLATDQLATIEREVSRILSSFAAGVPFAEKAKIALLQYLFEHHTQRDEILTAYMTAHGGKI